MTICVTSPAVGRRPTLSCHWYDAAAAAADAADAAAAAAAAAAGLHQELRLSYN